jgi:hypothetical protein
MGVNRNVIDNRLTGEENIKRETCFLKKGGCINE